MSTDPETASRRVMNQLGEERRIPVVNIAEGDIGVLLGSPLLGILFGGITGLDGLIVPLALVGLTVGSAIVYATPTHLTAWTWLQDVARFYLLRPRVTYSHPEESDHPATDGGLVQYSPFTPQERTQDLTGIRRAWPGAGVVEHDDGTMEAFLEVEPDNMDFAMSGDWQAIQSAGQQFANTELEFPLTFHATTRSFPVEQLIERLDDRLTDPDVRANDAFRELIEEYRDQRPEELAETQQLHYYLGIEVDRLAVYDRFDQERTPGEKLTRVPILGLLARPFVTRREDYVESELRAAMVEKADDRIRTVRTEFVETVPGWSATRLSTLELFLLNMEFWNGEEYNPDTAGGLLRERPAMDNARREAVR